MIRVRYIVDTDLTPRVLYELDCNGCDWRGRWASMPDSTLADAVMIARHEGWMRIDTGYGLRTYCGECAAGLREKHDEIRKGILR